MKSLFVIILLLFFNGCQALVKCNGIVTKLQLCSIHSQYNKGIVSTGFENFKFPLTVNSSITLIDTAEFNDDENTITLQIILSISWYAVTMKLESNDENK